MKHFRLPLVLCWLTLLAAAQNPGGWLSDLPQAKDYVQHRSSSYDRSGGNADARTIAPGETLTSARRRGARDRHRMSGSRLPATIRII